MTGARLLGLQGTVRLRVTGACPEDFAFLRLCAKKCSAQRHAAVLRQRREAAVDCV